MFKYGMSYEEVVAMAEAMGWEVLKEEEHEENGECWEEMTVLQEDHAVALGLDADGVYEIQFVPLWALG